MELTSLSAKDIRLLCRSNLFSKPTAGLCPSQTQANLLIVPSNYADDFRHLCARNPVSCPLLGESPAPGDPSFPVHLAKDGDIRTDAPKYHVYINGKLEKVVDDILEVWEEDSVAFFIGCSFSFEKALANAGLIPRHAERGTNVSMYRTKVPLNSAGSELSLLALRKCFFPTASFNSFKRKHCREYEAIPSICSSGSTTNHPPFSAFSWRTYRLGMFNFIVLIKV